MRLIGLAVVLIINLLVAPLAADAQQPKVYRIGVLSTGNPAPRPSIRLLSKDCTSWATSRARTSPSSTGTPRDGSIGFLASRPSWSVST